MVLTSHTCLVPRLRMSTPATLLALLWVDLYFTKLPLGCMQYKYNIVRPFQVVFYP
jgi:hypothetical protein